VSGSGSTLWELAYMQVPALLLVLADNQRGGARACEAAGMARLLGEAEGVTPSDVARATMALAGDADARAAMAGAGGRLVDGNGARRVVEALVDHAA
jgi:spore coat polysaccharide biosynthesis predicted glycosyltransferase SpsG